MVGVADYDRAGKKHFDLPDFMSCQTSAVLIRSCQLPDHMMDRVDVRGHLRQFITWTGPDSLVARSLDQRPNSRDSIEPLPADRSAGGQLQRWCAGTPANT